MTIFGDISKFLKLIVFGRFWQIWPDFAALPMAYGMPQYGLKTGNPHKS
jgi:hypothetical protein